MSKAIRRLAIRATYPVWHPMVFRILSYARERGIITSSQWHELAAMLDRTQIQYQALRRGVE